MSTEAVSLRPCPAACSLARHLPPTWRRLSRSVVIACVGSARLPVQSAWGLQRLHDPHGSARADHSHKESRTVTATLRKLLGGVWETGVMTPA